ncbi:hypothetical protein QOZ80_9BG0703810 [Eleusine coracana subsp. coracana]|nr:hypothetical protein QOZ80_9BG0703810 [Eleusine coracana subsp. coracana]
MEELVLALDAPASPTSHWYRVEVKVEGFLSIDSDGRKSYTKGFTRNWVVDSDSICLDFLMTSLQSEMTWGTNQQVVFWVFDKRLGEDVQLESDSQFVDVLEMYKPEKEFMLLASVYNKEICHPLSIVPPELPTTNTANVLAPIVKEGSTSSTTKAIDCDAIVAFEVDEDDPELPDVFDSVEEYVGVNDEYMYDVAPIAQPEQPDNAQAENVEQPNQSETTPSNQNDTAPPPAGGPFPTEIRKNSLLSVHMKVVPRCIHASRLQDERTIQIKTLPFEHNYSTTKLCEGKMATQSWVADRLADWVKKNPEKGSKAAKEKLEERYEIKLPSVTT